MFFFHFKPFLLIAFSFRIEAVQMIFVVLGSAMAALGFMILFVGFLATGATRHKVYRAWGSRVGGRISCIVFMAITYILQIVWVIILCLLSITTFVFTLFWKMCSKTEVQTHRTVSSFFSFDDFLFKIITMFLFCLFAVYRPDSTK